MTDTTKLEDGFYWVREFGEWFIRERRCGDWYLPYTKLDLGGNEFDEIDPRPIKREENK